MTEKIYLTVVGRNELGIIATLTNNLQTFQLSINDITQKILDDKFVLFMELESSSNLDIQHLKEHLEQNTKNYKLQIMLAHENLFNAMHRV
ncbi:ACT domain-containing protein [bacterium]|nr:ACT domain-containing protein [bacterium]